MKFHTPSAFGGGVDKALPLLKEAIGYFEAFEPKKYWPKWGGDKCLKLYNQALERTENQKGK